MQILGHFLDKCIDESMMDYYIFKNKKSIQLQNIYMNDTNSMTD